MAEGRHRLHHHAVEWCAAARDTAAAHVFTGLQVLHPRLFTGRLAEPFSLRELYKAAQSPEGVLTRMYGLIHEGDWLHVGTGEELAAAQAYFAAPGVLSSPKRRSTSLIT